MMSTMASVTMIFSLMMLTSSILLNNPASAQDTIEFEINEEYLAGSFIGSVMVDAKLKDQHPDRWQELEFGFLAQPNQDASFFTISPQGGEIRTAKKIDRESICPMQEECYVEIDAAVVNPRDLFQVIPTRIKIMDVNDNAPNFPEDTVTVRFSESLEVGSRVDLERAVDFDSPQNGVKSYRMLTVSDKFEVRFDADLQIVLLKQLDREQEGLYQLEILAIDGGSSPKTGTVTVNVEVEDFNDHAPWFEEDTYTVRVPEDLDKDMVFFTMEAFDSDAGEYGEVVYKITEPQHLRGSLFGIDAETGEVFLKEQLDFEKAQDHELEIVASDKGPKPLSAKATLKVIVEDVNDDAPVITVNTLTTNGIAQVYENTDPGEFVAHVSVFDGDAGPNGKVRCTLTHPDFVLLTMSREKQYKIVTAKSFDRETKALYTVELQCTDLGTSPLTTTKEFEVAVLDVNDHRPTFEDDVYHTSIPENNQLGAFIIKLNASDVDSGENARVKYTISGTNGKHNHDSVHLSATDGVVRAKTSFDFESQPMLQFVVVATDHGQPPKSSNVTVKVFIVDSNDEAPHFKSTPYSFTVEEEADDPVTIIGTMNATDREAPPYNQVAYTIEGREPIPETFGIDTNTGTLKTLKALDREAIPMYLVPVVAYDKQVPTLRTTATATIIVNDTNDHSPVVEYPNFRNRTIAVSNDIPTGHTIIKVSASDKDVGPNGQVTYKMYKGDDDGRFAINATSGIISSARKLTDVRYKPFNLTILVTDNGEIPRHASIDIAVVVDSTIAYLGAGKPKSSSDSSNLLIIIIVASVSGFLMVLLIIAIIALKTYDRKRNANNDLQYNTEAQTILKENPKALEAKESGKKGGKNKKKKKGAGGGGGVNFRLETETAPTPGRVVQGSEDLSQYAAHQIPLHGDKVLAQSSGRQRPYADSIAHPDSTFSPEQRYVEGPGSASHCSSPPLPLPPPAEDCRLEAHLLALLKRDCSQDNESASSAELSNADSGRGPSEEGDHHNHIGTPSKTHGLRGVTPQSLSSPRQPTHVVSPARSGQPVQSPRGGSGRLQRPPPPPQRRLYPGSASPPSYNDFVRNTRANSSARTTNNNDHSNNNNNMNINSNSSTPHSQPTVTTQSPSRHSNQSKDSSNHSNNDSSCSTGSQENVDPAQLQAEIDDLFFKGVVV